MALTHFVRNGALHQLTFLPKREPPFASGSREASRASRRGISVGVVFVLVLRARTAAHGGLLLSLLSAAESAFSLEVRRRWSPGRDSSVRALPLGTDAAATITDGAFDVGSAVDASEPTPPRAAQMVRRHGKAAGRRARVR